MSVAVMLVAATQGFAALDYGDATGFPSASQTVSADLAIGTASAAGNATDGEAANPTSGTADADDGTGYDEQVQMPLFPVGSATSLPIYVSANTGALSGNAGRIAVFVDWNGDGDVADTNETLATQNITGNGVKTFSLTPPAGTTTGAKFLRIRVTEGTTAPTFSGASALKGEVEDYIVYVVDPANSWTLGTAPATNGASINVPVGTVCALYDDGGPTGNYAASTNRTVNFVAPTGYELKVVFTQVDLPGYENTHDWVQVRDQYTHYFGQLGHFAPETYYSTVRQFNIQMSTDSDGVVGAGFAATIEAVPLTRYPLDATTQNTTISTNLAVLMDDGGFSNYTDSQNRHVTLCSTDGYPIVVDQVEDAVVLAAGDVLNFYNGPDTSSPLILSVDSTYDQFRVASDNPGNCLTVEFITNSSGNNQGFRAMVYTANRPGVTFLRDCWGGLVPASYSALAAHAGKPLVLHRSGYTNGNAPVCAGWVNATGNGIDYSKWSFCTQASDYAGCDFGDQVGSYTFNGVTVASGLSSVTTSQSARIAWVLANYPDYDYDINRPADRKAIQNAIWMIMGNGTPDSPMTTDIPANPSTATPVLTLARTTSDPQPSGGIHSFTLQTDQAEIIIRPSDGGALPTVTSGTASIAANADGSGTLTITGGGTQTVGLSLSRPDAGTVSLTAQATDVIYDPSTMIVYQPIARDSAVQDFFTIANQVSPEAEAAGEFVNILAVGNLVFVDVNMDGLYSAGTDTPVPGVTVQIFDAGADGQIGGGDDVEIEVGPDGILGNGDDAPGGMQTSLTGLYLFQNLPEGNYYVSIPASEFGVGGSLEGFLSITGQESGDGIDDGTAGGDNGDDVLADGVQSVVFSLTDNSEPIGESGVDSANAVNAADDNNVNLTVDFGFVCPVINVTPNPLSSGTVGTAYSASPSASGGIAPYTWSATGLPAGLSINPS
ncbi:MAG: hypothetical protein KDK99_14450, partial [Verrucomicrobiales bacterium]|nr:hypothetical protein [Verrucomicrobiales bacterium]